MIRKSIEENKDELLLLMMRNCKHDAICMPVLDDVDALPLPMMNSNACEFISNLQVDEKTLSCSEPGRLIN